MFFRGVNVSRARLLKTSGPSCKHQRPLLANSGASACNSARSAAEPRSHGGMRMRLSGCVWCVCVCVVCVVCGVVCVVWCVWCVCASPPPPPHQFVLATFCKNASPCFVHTQHLSTKHTILSALRGSSKTHSFLGTGLRSLGLGTTNRISSC